MSVHLLRAMASVASDAALTGAGATAGWDRPIVCGPRPLVAQSPLRLDLNNDIFNCKHPKGQPPLHERFVLLEVAILGISHRVGTLKSLRDQIGPVPSSRTLWRYQVRARRSGEGVHTDRHHSHLSQEGRPSPSPIARLLQMLLVPCTPYRYPDASFLEYRSRYIERDIRSHRSRHRLCPHPRRLPLQPSEAC